MSRALSLLFVSSLLFLGGCASLEGATPDVVMQTTVSRPPPLPVPTAPIKAPKVKLKREAAPVPLPAPAPTPPVPVPPPHHWYDHLKFWQK